jgi:hypothetical protein
MDAVGDGDDRRPPALRARPPRGAPRPRALRLRESAEVSVVVAMRVSRSRAGTRSPRGSRARVSGRAGMATGSAAARCVSRGWLREGRAASLAAVDLSGLPYSQLAAGAVIGRSDRAGWGRENACFNAPADDKRGQVLPHASAGAEDHRGDDEGGREPCDNAGGDDHDGEHMDDRFRGRRGGDQAGDGQDDREGLSAPLGSTAVTVMVTASGHGEICSLRACVRAWRGWGLVLGCAAEGMAVPLAVKELRPLRGAFGVLDREPSARHRQQGPAGKKRLPQGTPRSPQGVAGRAGLACHIRATETADAGSATSG